MSSVNRLTAERQARFLDMLAPTASVQTAARLAGVGSTTVYMRRRRDPAFAAAWDQSIEAGLCALETEARRRAMEGVEVPVVYRGRVVGTRVKYSDGLLIWLLRAADPGRFCE